MRIAHLSDTHLGYEAYRAMSAGGENQRGVDIARAFVRCADDIRDWDPSLVIHSGDLAERPQISVNLMLLARQQLSRMAGLRPDGSRRQVVIIAGNHDLPANRKEACYLELFRGIPGVHIVTDEYRIVRFENEDNLPAELRDVEVHCLPHDTLKDLAIEERFDEVQPTPGKTSILVAHGVAGGSGLYKRVIGREFPIPTDVLVRDWAYGALGHWHRQGPVSVAGAAGRCWYAGSSENMGFGDLLDNGTQRGYLRVEIQPGQGPKIEPRNLPIRSMFRLGAIDGAGMNPEQIADALRARIEKAKKDGTLAGAVVGQNVVNVPREIWALVDVHPLRELAIAQALHYEITVQPVIRNVDGNEGNTENTGTVRNTGVEILATVRERAKVLLRDGERDSALAVAEALLKKHLAHVSDDTIGDEDDSPSEAQDTERVPAAVTAGTDEQAGKTTKSKKAGAKKSTTGRTKASGSNETEGKVA